MRLRLRIRCVDMNGYLGRDFHPEPSDVGSVVIPLGMAGWHTDPNDGDTLALLDGGMAANLDHARDTDNHEVVWTCLAPDGRTLELMGHEVEIVPEEAR